MDTDLSAQQHQSHTDETAIPSSKLMNGGGTDLPINGKIESTDEKEINSDIDGRDDATEESEQETEQYMNGMESTTDVHNDDEDDEDVDEEEEAQAASLDNHFSMQADDDFEEEDENEAVIEESNASMISFSKYQSQMSEFDEYKLQNANIHSMHFRMLQARHTAQAIQKRAQRDATNELNAFKEQIISNLLLLRDDYSKQQNKIQKLQQNLNASHMERKKISMQKDKLIKAKESENKSLRAKNNEAKSEYTRIKQSVDKIKRDNDLANEQIVKKMEKLQEEKQKLNAQLDKQKELVEEERREKMAVSDKNSEYLRNEKIKISKALEKERKDRIYLEEKVIALQDECKENVDAVKAYSEQNKKLAQMEKTSTNLMNKSLREKEASAAKLLEKTKYFKQQHAIFDATQSQMKSIQKQCDDQRAEMKRLNDCIRKKTEKEKEFSDIRKRLLQREKKLEEREKNMRLKYKQQQQQLSKKGKQWRNDSSPSKQLRKEKGFRDPLAPYKHLLPFHWICVGLLVVLMIAVSQRR